MITVKLEEGKRGEAIHHHPYQWVTDCVTCRWEVRGIILSEPLHHDLYDASFKHSLTHTSLLPIMSDLVEF